MKITPLVFGTILVSPEKTFSRYTESSSLEGLRMGIQPFLVEMDSELILVDLGIELGEEDRPWILRALEKQGYKESDITAVLLSHLHKDHLMGIGSKTEEGVQLHFSKAKIYVQERELSHALENKMRYSFDEELLDALKEHPGLTLMKEESGTIFPGVRFQLTGGHSPFHQVFWFTNKEEIYFYGADNLPQYNYWRRKVAYKSDFDGKKARDLREEWKILAEDENWNVMFYHDVKKPLVLIK